MKDLILEHKDDFRMYGLVPYNISSIQQGIQFGHALQEYNNYFIDNLIKDEKEKEAFESWRLFGKTFIILNGGTTNNRLIDGAYVGSLNRTKEELGKNGILNATFKEPDLGEQLTAVVFLVPKQVYNKKQFPDFLEYSQMNSEFNYEFFEKIKEEYELGFFYDENVRRIYDNWVDFIGGEKNVFLREFLKNFKLA
jgi:hypothetical protein